MKTIMVVSFMAATYIISAIDGSTNRIRVLELLRDCEKERLANTRLQIEIQKEEFRAVLMELVLLDLKKRVRELRLIKVSQQSLLQKISQS
jgi:hypothetical protein